MLPGEMAEGGVETREQCRRRRLGLGLDPDGESEDDTGDGPPEHEIGMEVEDLQDMVMVMEQVVLLNQRVEKDLTLEMMKQLEQLRNRLSL